MGYSIYKCEDLQQLRYYQKPVKGIVRSVESTICEAKLYTLSPLKIMTKSPSYQTTSNPLPPKYKYI